MKKVIFICALFLCIVFSSCSKTPEMSLDEIENAQNDSNNYILANTKYKPYNGQKFKEGRVSGTWNDCIIGDPKTFNCIVGEVDSISSSLINMTTVSLVVYDPLEKEWRGDACSYEIETDKENDILTVHFTLRDDLYWSYYNKDEKIPVTSDDIVWWYNNVTMNPFFRTSGYNSCFVKLADGSKKLIQVKKVDDKRFDFIYPRIIANPLLSSNKIIRPSFLFKKVMDEKGAGALLELFSIDTDPSTIPSCGQWYIKSYTPSQNIVLSRNPNYYEKDKNGVSIPYTNEMILRVIPNTATETLLFKEGKMEMIYPSVNNLSKLIKEQEDKYTIYRTEGTGTTSFISFNQNPKNKDKPYYSWFTKKEFRQAISCLLDRERIINQTYRGLATAKLDFFPEGSPFYNEDIKNKYTYNPKKAIKLLKSIGYKQDDNNIMRDDKGNAIEFDLLISESSSTISSYALLLSEECAKVGIKLNIRQLDFQKIVQMVTKTYDWESVIIALGSNFFPTQGSNVWNSSGNLHLWNPLQKEPATQWEERIDTLYREGSYTVDKKEAQKIWDEYQEILLEQCPLIYLFQPLNFVALSNRWDHTNMYCDNLNGVQYQWLYLME